MADSNIAVRLAHRKDLASLLDLLPQITSRPDSLAGTTPDLDESMQIFDRICASENVHIVVAQEQGSDVLMGALTLVIVPNLTYGGRPWSMIENVVVRRGCRGEGIGKGLMDFAVRFAQGRGCYKTQLLSGPNDDQVGFYRSVGFEDEKCRGFKRYFVDR